MRTGIAAFVVVAVFTNMFVAIASAGYEEGLAAYRQGDYATAVKEYKLSAEKGDARSQLTLGLMYETGNGVNVDSNEAVKWYNMASMKVQDRYNKLVEAKEAREALDRSRTYLAGNSGEDKSDAVDNIENMLRSYPSAAGRPTGN